jgi:NitT/TauT family transport system substrate-binding protein
MRRLLTIATTVLVAAGCTTTPAPETTTTTVRVASLTGPTTMSLVGLLSEDRYAVDVYGTADEVVPLLTQGTVDVACIPANLAAVLDSKTDGAIQVLSINVLGVLSVLEHGSTVNSLADLRGRTVYSTGQGTTPQYVLEHLLRQVGLDPGTDVTVEYLSEATEVAARLAAEPGAIGVLPQPYATAVLTQHPDVRQAVDLSTAWDDLDPDSRLVTAVTVVRRDFAEAHPDAVQALLVDLQSSVTLVNESPDLAAPLIVSAGVVDSADVAEQAIPASHLVAITGTAMRTALEGYLQVLYDADPASVGGAMPGDDFYLD